jgi:hypothetical protein
VIIRTVRAHQPLSLFLIPFIGILLWLPAFINPTLAAQEVYRYDEVYMPFYNGLDQFLRQHELMSVILGFLFSLGEAFLLNYIIYEHHILTKRSWLPALLFVVLSGCTPGLLWLNPQLIAGIFLLLALHFLLGTYRMDKAFGQVFNSGILIGIAALFYLPSIVFLFFAIAALIILRPFIWREWIVLILGSTIAPIYAGVYFFWHDKLYYMTHNIILWPVIHRDFFLKLPSEYYFLSGMLVLLLFVAGGRFLSGAGTSTLKTKKGISVIIWFLLFSVIAILPAQNFAVAGFLFSLFPLALLISNYFLVARRIWLAESIFLLLLASILFSYAMHFGWIVFI